MAIDNKLYNYLQITDFINNMLRPKKTLKKTKIKLHNTLAFSALLYGSDNWTVIAKRRQKNNSRRGETNEKNSRINLDTL